MIRLNRKTKLLQALLTLALSVSSVFVSAQTFLLPANGDSVVGSVSLTTSRHEDTLSDLAWAYDQGFLEMRYANPDVDAWLPGEGTEIIIPSRYVLPDTPRNGIVINVPEMRLYYYPKARHGEPATVLTYPISIGRQDWATPYGTTKIISKVKNPGWTPPASIKKEHAEKGDPLPDFVPSGPDNPLGKFAMGLGKRGYLIHGTNKPYGLGMRVTHGCIRLYPKNIEELFSQVSVGTTVRIINQPYKAGWLKGKLYLEAHPSLEENENKPSTNYQQLVSSISAVSLEDGADQINWEQVNAISEKQSGVPVQVGKADYGQPPLLTDNGDLDEGRSRPIKEVMLDHEDIHAQETTSFSDLF